MLISQTAEYALRAMAHVVLTGDKELVRARDVAAATGVPLAYASKVLKRLVQVKLLESQRGHHGGFRLTRPPRQIKLIDVLSALDETLLDDHCLFGRTLCDLTKPCPLHHAFFPLKQAVLDWSRRTTLEDVRLGASVKLPVR